MGARYKVKSASYAVNCSVNESVCCTREDRLSLLLGVSMESFGSVTDSILDMRCGNKEEPVSI